MSMLRSEKQHQTVTVNSEMLVASLSHKNFHDVLIRSDLNLPDSQGIVWMGGYTGQIVPERVTGVDTVSALCSRLTEADPIFLLGAAPGVAERAAAVLMEKYPHLRVAGTVSGSPRGSEAQAIIAEIKKLEPRVLFVAFGSPAQELWIATHLSSLPSVRLAMGVGGTFDFLAGIRKRAPKAFQKLGLEWLWRLILEPRRLPRIFNAVIVFPFQVFLSQWRRPRGASR